MESRNGWFPSKNGTENRCSFGCKSYGSTDRLPHKNRGYPARYMAENWCQSKSFYGLANQLGQRANKKSRLRVSPFRKYFGSQFRSLCFLGLFSAIRTWPQSCDLSEQKS